MADPVWLYVQCADFHCYLPGALRADSGQKWLNSVLDWAQVQKKDTNIMAYPDILIWNLSFYTNLTSAMQLCILFRQKNHE